MHRHAVVTPATAAPTGSCAASVAAVVSTPGLVATLGVRRRPPDLKCSIVPGRYVRCPRWVIGVGVDDVPAFDHLADNDAKLATAGRHSRVPIYSTPTRSRFRSIAAWFRIGVPALIHPPAPDHERARSGVAAGEPVATAQGDTGGCASREPPRPVWTAAAVDGDC